MAGLRAGHKGGRPWATNGGMIGAVRIASIKPLMHADIYARLETESGLLGSHYLGTLVDRPPGAPVLPAALQPRAQQVRDHLAAFEISMARFVA